MKPTRTYPLTRLRRLRQTPVMRALIAETQIRLSDLIYPVFIQAGDNVVTPINAMPGLYRYTIDSLIPELEQLILLGISAIAVFPVIDPILKTSDARYAYDPEGLLPRAIQAMKRQFPDLLVIADVALDPYTSHGHDGVLDVRGDVANDETVDILCKQALCLVKAGVDIVAPSDMMDGRVLAIRQALDEGGFPLVPILSYAAKYASAFYGPFREAVGSAAALGHADKRRYQMDPANADEALQEVALDLQEGADIILIKPGLPYLDVLYRVKQTFQVPTFVYQVSGEYAMLKHAARSGTSMEVSLVMESLLAFKRAGADAILTYYAKQVAEWVRDGILAL